MRKVVLIILIYLCITPLVWAENQLTSNDEVLFAQNSPFELEKSSIELIQKQDIEYDDYGFQKPLKERFIDILPTDEECQNLKQPPYLLRNITTIYPEKGFIESFYTGFAFKGSLNINMFSHEHTHIDESYNMLENHFLAKFKDGKTKLNITTRYAPRDDISFMHFLIGNAYISHQLTPHNRIMIGNSRTHTGEEGSKQLWIVPFMSYAQISRNFGNIRKLGVRMKGDYDLFEYDIGGYSSDTYFHSFFPGAEFAGWLTLKPLGKTNGKYGEIRLGGGLTSGHKNIDYNVAGCYTSYEYKKFRADFEFANADGYNGNLGLSQNHARGMYSTVAYKITPKLEILARYDSFQPNLDVSRNSIKEYVAGINYFIKGQALRLIINYVYRQNSFDRDSHRIILGTQIIL